MAEYIHKVQYYETDRMGITHHSHYVRWMEEARVAFLNRIGYGYKRLEEDGVVSPVVSIECQYKRPTTFDDEIAISIVPEKYNGVTMVIGYSMVNLSANEEVCTAKSTHCFLDKEGRLVNLKKKFPDFDTALRGLL